MNIPSVKSENISNSQPVFARIVGKTSPKAPEQQDNFIARKEEMMEALHGQSTLRPEVVAKGKALVSDPNYPSMDKMEDLARLLTKGYN